MGTRKDFLAAACASTLFAAVPVSAQTKPSRKPSEMARAFAERMRAYDPQITEEELDSIARSVDDTWSLGKRLNPKGKALRNGDEPIVSFEVGA
ncbi:MAG: hypothetical protein ACXWNK_00185 [Vulcanimicrobiaceae bacterium]